MGKTRQRRYIIYVAQPDEPGWEQRYRVNNGHESFTDILAEEFDSSDSPLPKPGDRVLELVTVPGFEDSRFPGASTHHRDGEWQVSRIEEYTPDIPVGMAFGTIVLCFCRYAPINNPLNPLPPIQVNADSFGGDEQAYQEWLETQKQPVRA
ncbi:MAG: hypothetical protein SFW36_08360 [Leptolyngbyaceae cyanobacterium bins.59]|nr:hypothetical protein [Leptolyngbyaceae cyanobacterium bins.59]